MGRGCAADKPGAETRSNGYATALVLRCAGEISARENGSGEDQCGEVVGDRSATQRAEYGAVAGGDSGEEGRLYRGAAASEELLELYAEWRGSGFDQAADRATGKEEGSGEVSFGAPSSRDASTPPRLAVLITAALA